MLNLIKNQLSKIFLLTGGFMKKSGFTIIELMIVVAIIAFLATVSVPKYFKYHAKAKQAEVAMNLASLHTAQQAYFAENGTYSKVLNGPDGIGWQPQGNNFYYTYGFNFPGAKEGIHYFVGKLGAKKESLGQTQADKTGFIVSAAGDVIGKQKIDLWQIDQDRNLKNVQKGIE
ncbi:prepilin-type N-terminal cleavage/methylation domain-containing protein [Candidatus Dependentiae bacterium]|nr:prepilin-type N-terminal cleavage/methylation domain-containing protein [Candidatus Dependentiae bacterium]